MSFDTRNCKVGRGNRGVFENVGVGVGKLHPESEMAVDLRNMAVCGEWAVGL